MMLLKATVRAAAACSSASNTVRKSSNGRPRASRRSAQASILNTSCTAQGSSRRMSARDMASGG
jgi:hypothetical protein